MVSTTRPETILGDVAVAVNPSDHRYSHLVGRSLVHPFRTGETIPVIADEVAKPDFGTGAVKITPGHDPIDLIVGKRHSLLPITVIDEEGKICLEGSQFKVIKIPTSSMYLHKYDLTAFTNEI